MKRTAIKAGGGLLALLLALSACGWVAAPDRELSRVVREYTMRLRWMDFPGAARHFEAGHREDFLQRVGGLKDLHVVGVDLDSLDFSDGDRRARTTIVLEYYILPSATVVRRRVGQKWAYQDADRYHSGVWRIVTPFPEFP